MYITYEEYIDMGGTLENSPFLLYYYEIEALIDYCTFNRIATSGFDALPIPTQTKIKQCLFQLITLLANKQNALNIGGNGTGSVASQSNDGVSVSYNSLNAQQLVEYSQKESYRMIHQYLSGCKTADNRNLLYRGIYPNE